MTLRLEHAVYAWVQARGGVAFVRGLVERAFEAREEMHGDAGLLPSTEADAGDDREDR